MDKRVLAGFYMSIMGRVRLCGNNGWWKAKNEHGLGHPTKVEVASAEPQINHLRNIHLGLLFWTRLLRVFLLAGRVFSFSSTCSVYNPATQQCPSLLTL